MGDWAARGGTYWPDRIAVDDEARDQSFTYAALDSRSDCVAAWLRRRGIRKGDRVGGLMHNGIEVLDVLFACGKLGAIFVPYNWRLEPHELGGLFRLTGPCVLFCSPELTSAGRASVAHAGASVEIIDTGGPAIRSTTYEDIVATDPFSPSGERIGEESLSAEDTWVLLFSGGTTGVPKAVRVTHRMAAWNVLTTTIHHIRHDDVTLVHTPMFHTGGLFVHAVPLLSLGGKVVIARRWDTTKVLEVIEREKLTVLFAVPTQLQDMMVHPRFEETDFASVRLLISGGAALPGHVPPKYLMSHGIRLAQGFGMTEFGPNALMLSPDEAAARTGSIGKPNSFVDACVLAPSGRRAKTGEVGELCLRGGALFSGYYGVEGSPVGEDGWFHTGDLARIDDGGYFSIAGRLKEMFVSGGENIYPTEIEEALYLHTDVRLCAVIGVPDDRWGEVGQAFVVLAEGSATQTKDLIGFLRTRIAGYKVPKRLDIVPTLPVSSAGKILKRELRPQVHGERALS